MSGGDGERVLVQTTLTRVTYAVRLTKGDDGFRVRCSCGRSRGPFKRRKTAETHLARHTNSHRAGGQA